MPGLFRQRVVGRELIFYICNIPPLPWGNRVPRITSLLGMPDFDPETPLEELDDDKPT
jgi:hypothetical protein